MRTAFRVRIGSKLFAAIAVAILLFSAGAASAQAPARTPAGTITSASGDVQIQRTGAAGAAVAGSPVYVGDRIVTGPGGHVVVTLSDRSRLELGDSSNLVIDAHALAPA